ncbi:peptide-methionine (R)-S-oxide reductase MsrB [Salipiger mucosus]|uniref:peptide-methionine (R)-S-oxide reductase n=1 Tax=Salipiger mucosus DSM 16094 TaxID=1123237 RepID=S9QRE5_9RHOB|nr:peptide-methionine (R)-S-oxide reductase MsrB [Salipiger mucosus]EPX82217.1 Peptide methionine sulfoxide reductase MsrB [Salipiger mucosus DSM 16094]
MTRRGFLAVTAAMLGGGALATRSGGADAAENFEVTRSEEEWRAMLTDLEYKVMREEGTERAFTSPLNDEKREGTFLCKGCDQELYASDTKFDSGTGWPSFYEPLPDAVETKPDRSLFMVRTEVHCDRCGSHLGHIFDDGPPPTGKRHCINGVSLTFRPASA